ncbi:MAG: protein phosphatase CheZ [Gammaproteobacteria bacterium]|nr:protein phosphatase CheZ [Gammaproteobacteria bacterium]
MKNAAEFEDKRLDLAQQLVVQIEANNETKVRELLLELTQVRDGTLFCEVGKLTRELHDTLNNFRLDTHISSVTERDIPDAKKRLSHVIEMTENSALRTLNAVESGVELSKAVRNRTQHLKDGWESFRRREMTPDQFRQLNRDIDSYLDKMDRELALIHGNLSEIMMAQETQDLSGQIIRQVIQLVQNVENSLVDLIRITGQAEPAGIEHSAGLDESRGSGPTVPGVDSKEAVQSQDEVDELLSSLGF